MNNKAKTERRVNDIKMYLAVIYETLVDNTLTFNDVPLPELVRFQVVLDEMIKLLSVIGIKKEKFVEYMREIDFFDETTPESRELESVVKQAISEVKEELGA